MPEMSLTQLASDLRTSLHDSAGIFTDSKSKELERLITIAAHDFGRVRKRTLVGSLTLVADQSDYPAPADLIQPKSIIWGANERRIRKPWESDHPGPPHTLRLVEIAGVRTLIISPIPTAVQITNLTATCRYYYCAGHVVDEDETLTSVRPEDRGLLILRAQAEAMLEMSTRNIHKPVQLRDGMSQGPRNGTPAALYEQLMESFERQARAN